MRLLSALLLCLVLLVTRLAGAQSAAEVRTRARQVTAPWPAGHPPSEEAALRSAISQLGELTLQFIALSEQAAQRGRQGQDRSALLEAYRAIGQPLEAIYDQTGGALERMARKVIDEDGDLEALYESAEYRRAGAIGAQALYYLNWLRFYGARLYDGSQRKELLEKALRGFGEFSSSEDDALRRESLLGRGLCALELGELDSAARDLQAVAEDPQQPSERRAKARLALLDAYVRHGRYREAAQLSQQMLQQGSSDHRVLFLRARALLELARKVSGVEADRLRKDALSTLEPLERAGGVWAERARALLLAQVDDPARWAKDTTDPRARLELAKMLLQKKDFSQAIAILEELGKRTAALPSSLEVDRRYLLGLAQFQSGLWQAAARNLEFALTHQKGDEAAEAAYLRFKAYEQLAAEPSQETDLSAYERAIRDYVEQFPEHRSSYEGFFRLGELLQNRKLCAEAVKAYERVKGDPEFGLRARFAALQCKVALLAEQGPPSQTALAEVGDEIVILTKALADQQGRQRGDRTVLSGLEAKLLVIRAAWQSWQERPDWQQILSETDRFEERFARHSELFATVARLRLGALLRLGRFAEAEQLAERRAPLLVTEYGTSEVEQLAALFVRAGTEKKNQGESGADIAAQRVALQLYRALVDADPTQTKFLFGLARLYENTGDPSRALELYEQVLTREPASLPTLRALARLTEARGDSETAKQYWQRYTSAARPGDAPWYEGTYQLARLEGATGDARGACARLDGLKPAMPGLSDRELRQQLDQLYQRLCR